MRISRFCSATLAAFGWTVIAVIVGASFSQAAQAPNPAAQPQASPSETGAGSNDHRISIDVIVADKQGHPVRGLKAGDFTLLDNKAPQKLVAFRATDAETLRDAPVHVVIVVDMINANFDTVAREREELSQFLKQDGGELAHPTSIAIFADSGAKLQQGFTRDGNALNASFGKQQSALRTIGRNTGFYGAADRLQMSLDQLRELAASEATLPGRKLILVIGPGWPLLPGAGNEADVKQRTWVFNNIVQFANGLREAHIALYCLDPYDLGRTDPFYYQAFRKGVSAAKNAEYPSLALQVLAEHSGGQVIINGRDIVAELNTAVLDAGASYELTFEGAPGDHPNEYHALQVHIDWPNVIIRTTAGYYAHAQPSGQ